jgi:hypothetical protein
MIASLEEFVRRKHQEYQEPQREGTPRGEPVGLSKNKHLAALWCLSGLELKEIARNVGVSYGLLRKWRTEGPFKETIKKLVDEFVQTVIGYLKENHAEVQENFEGFLECVAKEHWYDTFVEDCEEHIDLRPGLENSSSMIRSQLILQARREGPPYELIIWKALKDSRDFEAYIRVLALQAMVGILRDGEPLDDRMRETLVSLLAVTSRYIEEQALERGGEKL